MTHAHADTYAQRLAAKLAVALCYARISRVLIIHAIRLRPRAKEGLSIFLYYCRVRAAAAAAAVCVVQRL